MQSSSSLALYVLEKECDLFHHLSQEIILNTLMLQVSSDLVCHELELVIK